MKKFLLYICLCLTLSSCTISFADPDTSSVYYNDSNEVKYSCKLGGLITPKYRENRYYSAVAKVKANKYQMGVTDTGVMIPLYVISQEICYISIAVNSNNIIVLALAPMENNPSVQMSVIGSFEILELSYKMYQD